MPWILVAAVSLAVLLPLAPAAPPEVSGELLGGRLSRACRAGIWLVMHGQHAAGLALMWFGC